MPWLGRDAAITSALPGTTRDAIEAPVAYEGLPFLLVDTAGLRDGADAIEAIGIDRARARIAAADLVLWLGDPAERPDGAIVLHAKADLGGATAGADLSVSAKTGQGMAELVRILIRHSASILRPPADAVAPNARQRAALAEAAAALREAEEAGDLLIAAEALRRARIALDRITGRAGVEDMLDALFGRFCIGK